MPDAPRAHCYRIGEFWFDPRTGELASHDNGEAARTLAPQPAGLLLLLAENPGSLVTHETIRDRLWPDALVEYDQGVHHCMRLIRSALGDSARTPEFIETLPKRGYRLLAHVTPPSSGGDAPTTTPHEVPAPSHTSRPDRKRMILALAASAALLALVVVSIARVATPSPSAVTVGIMPFAHPDAPSLSQEVGPIAELLVAELTTSPKLAIIGPSTTRQHAGETSLKAAAQDLDAAYLVHPRFVNQDGTWRVLVEIIRASDGAHVWTRWLDSPVDAEQAAGTIAPAVRSAANR